MPASVIVAHGLSCSTACGIFPDEESNPCLVDWQADSQPLDHEECPVIFFLLIFRNSFYVMNTNCLVYIKGNKVQEIPHGSVMLPL